MTRIDRDRLAFLLATTLILGACDGSGSDDDDDPEEGELTFVIGDAPSHEISSCVVEVTSLRLNRANGESFDLLDAAVQVDLAAMTRTTLLLALEVLPFGNYPSLDVGLDFTNASCTLAGQTAPAAIFGSDGNPLAGPVPLHVEFATPLLVSSNDNRLIELDFDLDRAVLADLVGNTVVIEPVLLPRVNPTVSKLIVVRGRVVNITPSAKDMVIQMESDAGVPLRVVTCEGDGETVYEIDGVAYQGGTGLSVLDAVPAGAWIEVEAEVDGDSPELDAVFVVSGSGSYNGGLDSVHGYVTDRIGGAGADATLTVVGHSSDATHTTTQFNTTFTVMASFADTRVVRHNQSSLHDLDDVNIGQLVQVYGSLAGNTLDASAVGSVLRTEPVWLLGPAEGPSINQVLTIDLQSVHTLPANTFQWANSGSTPADPAHLTMMVGTLDTGLAIVPGSLVSARGHFASIDIDTEDFVADKLDNLDSADRLIVIKDVAASGFDLVTSTSPDVIVFHLTGVGGAGETATLHNGLAPTIALPTVPEPAVLPPLSGFHGSLLDRDTGQVRLFDDFQEFSDALGLELAAGARVATFGASGTYDATFNQLIARDAAAVIE